MRRLVLYLVVVLLLILAVFIVFKGVDLGIITISSYFSIVEANADLEDQIADAIEQKDVKYIEALKTQQQAYKTLMSEKESYQQLLQLGVDENGIPLSKIQEYEIEKIWITLGNYADKQGVDLKMEITVNNSVAKTYDLNFTVVGEYIQIADFLYDIQRDNTLVFKIENFKLVSTEQITETETNNTESTSAQNTESVPVQENVTSYDLTATFVCKDIRLNIVDPTTEDSTDGEATDGETTNNSTESTNTQQATQSTDNTTESTSGN